MLHHKKLLITLCMGAAVVFTATVSMKSDPEPVKWKNLKVLPKTISKEDLDKVMDEWRDALGVRCGFCHARDEQTQKTDFASDAKPEKEMARKMYEMTEKINKKYFKAEKGDKEMMAAITCYACHHGAAHPESTAPPRAQRGPGFGPPGQNMPGGQGGMRPNGGQGTPPPPPPTPPATTTPPSK